MTRDEADRDLWEWGKWSNHRLDACFASENTIGKLMREGPGASQPTGKVEIAQTDSVARIEAVVLKMIPEIRRAVKAKYKDRLIDAVAAKRCQCGTTTYQNRIESAKSFVMGYVAAA